MDLWQLPADHERRDAIRWENGMNREEKFEAKREYQCFLCEFSIEVGTAYVKRPGDDSPYPARLHPECRAFTEHLQWTEDDWEEAITGDDFREELLEAVDSGEWSKVPATWRE